MSFPSAATGRSQPSRRRRRRSAPYARQDHARPRCLAEPLEERVLFAAALKLGGSGYSGTLSTNTATRQQQLICDPAEPFRGSTSVTYDASLVSLSGLTMGPGYTLVSGFVAISNFNGGENLVPISQYLADRPGGETGYVQITYQLTGKPGQIQPPTSNTIVDEAGVDGIDTHALLFEERNIILGPAAVPTYTIQALNANTRAGNQEDFLVVNDPERTRLGPAQLAPATVSPSPTDGSLSGTVYEDVDGDGQRDAADPPLAGASVYLDLNNNGIRDVRTIINRDGTITRVPEPTRVANEDGTYLFDNLSPGTYNVRLITPADFVAPPSVPASGVYNVSVTAGRRVRGLDFGMLRAVRVTNVFVNGTSWAPSFRKYLADNALGENAYGFNVGAGAAALDELPWANVNQVSIRFSSPANVGPYHLSIVGARNGALAITNFAYDVATRTATWTLAKAVPADRVTLDLNGDAGGVADPFGHSLLDGETTNDALPSGNGTVGGDFQFVLNVLPGDADRSGATDAGDLVKIRNRGGTSTGNPGTPPNNNYTPFFDVDGSGAIDAGDLVLTRNNGGSTLPAANLAAAVAPAPFSARLVAGRDSKELADLIA